MSIVRVFLVLSMVCALLMGCATAESKMSDDDIQYELMEMDWRVVTVEKDIVKKAKQLTKIQNGEHQDEGTEALGYIIYDKYHTAVIRSGDGYSDRLHYVYRYIKKLRR